MYTEKLFSYGTLKLEKVQIATFGRSLTGSIDALCYYVLKNLPITNPEVIAKSGIAIHPVATYTGYVQDEIPGIVFDVSAEELLAADKYEAADYKRISVRLKSGLAAWLYVSH